MCANLQATSPTAFYHLFQLPTSFLSPCLFSPYIKQHIKWLWPFRVLTLVKWLFVDTESLPRIPLWHSSTPAAPDPPGTGISFFLYHLVTRIICRGLLLCKQIALGHTQHCFNCIQYSGWRRSQHRLFNRSDKITNIYWNTYIYMRMNISKVGLGYRDIWINKVPMKWKLQSLLLPYSDGFGWNGISDEKE